MNTEVIFKEVVQTKYRQGFYVSSQSNEDSNRVALLSCIVPRIITDDKSDLQIVKFLKISNVAKITLDPEQKVVFTTAQSTALDRVQEGLSEINMKTEQIVLNTIYDKLAKISMVRAQLNPIYIILKRVYQGGFKKSDISKLGIKKEKYKTYLRFLCELNILRETEDAFTEGNYFIEIRSALTKTDEETVLNKVFGLAIKDGKTYLLNNLHFNVLKPFIRLSNVYYLSSLMFNKLLALKHDTFRQKYHEVYGKYPELLKFESQVDQLTRSGIFHDGEFISGDKDIFAKLMKMNQIIFN